MYDNVSITVNQCGLFDNLAIAQRGVFPSTRYQGSKNKLVKWIDYCTKDLSFETVIDVFGGTGCIGHMFKNRRKQVFYNDILKFNYYIGLALIENSKIILEEDDINFILTKQDVVKYPSFIENTFKDIYFTDAENQWLDFVITNINSVKNKYKRALAHYAVFQACIIKRPYNLFHRKNLYIRNAEVKRSFGNKVTWDASFDYYFRKFAKQANKAVFENKRQNRALNFDVFDLNIKADMVYIDTPYISQKGVGIDYLDFYHFLEGITDYNSWDKKIEKKSKHKKFKSIENVWNNKDKIEESFDKLFEKFQNSILVISYRNDGIPSIEKLVELLSKYKKNIDVKQSDYKYVLSGRASKEILIIAQ
ncbi:MAG: DNA adenine methylase [Endomicrobium sp.]|jgi:adenine-specific DNA methylase|nr:DNA adenine methylase [Endomicrobium sp.]